MTLLNKQITTFIIKVPQINFRTLIRNDELFFVGHGINPFGLKGKTISKKNIP